MKKAFPIALMVFGLVFLGAGGYTVNRGFDAKNQVRAELLAQNITTPEDAAVPNLRVRDAHSARVMADVIDEHARKSTGGLTYSELGRYAAKSGDVAGTNVDADAVKGSDGKPVPNPVRNVAFQASALRTSLYASVMAFNVADLVIGLGFMILALGVAVGGIGVALGGLAIPFLGRRLHVEPVAAIPVP
jgi:hypothetical protein